MWKKKMNEWVVVVVVEKDDGMESGECLCLCWSMMMLQHGCFHKDLGH